MSTATHCPYCAFQCAILIEGMVAGDATVAGDPSFPVNRGRLCVKGFTSTELIQHPDRLLYPLVRNERGVLERASWADALAYTARALRAVQERHGPEAVGVFGSGALTNEKAYSLGKFARVVLRTPNIDYNGRYCMSSAAAASIRALGIDRGLPFPVEDMAGADVILLAGGNLAETMPPITQHLDAQRARGGRLILVDPRRSATASGATLHLAPIPGTDTALANGLLHILIRDQRIDRDFVQHRTEGFERVRATVGGYWPTRVERITGVGEAQLEEAARTLGEARSVMILTGRGPEQQSRGVANVLAYINLALALGAPGRPCSGYGCVTGQGNGQGGREHGQKADQLPGYRSITDPAAREHVAGVWGVPVDSLPGPGRSAYEMLSTLGDAGAVRALLVVGSNPVVSSPDADAIDRRFRRLDFLAVSDFFLSETATLADVVFPSAQWAEEEGTMTNLEGRVIRRRQAFSPPAEVRSDLEMLAGLAAAMGEGPRFPAATPAEVFEELRRASAGGPADYAGITYERMEREQGVFWPCPSEDHPGTPRLFADGFPTPTTRARFHPVRHEAPQEEPDAEFPLYLTTGRLLAHYQSGTQTRRVPRLVEMAPCPSAQVHPAVASTLGLRHGDQVVLRTRRASARFRLEVVATIREDTVFLPFHWGGAAGANRLTHPALDPVSRMPDFKVCAVRLENPSRAGAGS
jgi:assimilatory nitrate reductase catalytic subunit